MGDTLRAREALLPCPFCGGAAERLELEDEANFGGSCICCKVCGASSSVHFDRKENLDSSWNERAALTPQPSSEAGEEVVERRLFLDCDGVLADFDTAFESRFGHPPRSYEDKHGPKVFWEDIKTKAPDFYRTLPLMADAKELFDAVSHLRPIILTGCPLGGWAEMQKLAWAAEHFPGVPMVTCMSKNKRLYCRPGDVLIDDYLKYKNLWEEAGGVFIHHRSAKESARAAIAALPRQPLQEREEAIAVLEQIKKLEDYIGPSAKAKGEIVRICDEAIARIRSAPADDGFDARALVEKKLAECDDLNNVPFPYSGDVAAAWMDGRRSLLEWVLDVILPAPPARKEG